MHCFGKHSARTPVEFGSDCHSGVFKKWFLEKSGSISRTTFPKLSFCVFMKSIFKNWFKGDAPTPTEKRTFASAVKVAQSIFKRSALSYYASRNVILQNPFECMELVAPKISPFVPHPPKLF
jgi:hypothetical protein